MHTRPIRQAFLTLALSWLLLGFGPALASENKGGYYGAMQTDYPSWFKESFLDLREDVAEAKTAGKRVMLVFHQDNCPYCNVLVERNLSQKAIETQLRSHFDVIAMNMWGDRDVTGIDGKPQTEKTFAASLKVQFTPTILFFDETGQVALRLNGYIPPQRFKLALDYVQQRQEKAMSFRDYVATQSQTQASAPSQGELHRQPFFRPAPYDLKRGAKGRPVAVYFEQKDCPSCDVLHQQVLVDPETRALARRFHAVQLDMWSATPVVTPQGQRSTAREWARQLDVKYAPTIVLFDAQGREIIRSEAFFKVFHTQGLHDYVLSGAYKTEPSFQRYLSARAEAIREQGKDVDIWSFAGEKPERP